MVALAYDELLPCAEQSVFAGNHVHAGDCSCFVAHSGKAQGFLGGEGEVPASDCDT